MQEGDVFGVAPLPAVDGIIAKEVERAGNGAAVAAGDDEQDAIGHPFADEAEEAAGEIGAAPFACPCILITGPHHIPVGRGNRTAGQRIDGHLRLRGCPLLADRLALACRQRGEKSVEVAIAPVKPVILRVAPRQPARSGEQRHLSGRDKGCMGG